MEDITAALCLDNRLRRRLYPTPLANRGKPRDFCFYPPHPFFIFFLSLPASLPHFLSSPSPIDLSVVFSICQWFMPAGGLPNPLSGRTTVSTVFHSHCIYGGRGGEMEERKREGGGGLRPEVPFQNRLWADGDKLNKASNKQWKKISACYTTDVPQFAAV